jgi:hypothetical protein
MTILSQNPPAVDRINHILAEMSLRVADFYSQQISDFDTSIARIESTVAKAVALKDLHHNLSQGFFEKVSSLLGFKPPRDVEYAIRHASANTYPFAELSDETGYFNRDNHFSAFGAGKDAAHLAIISTLFRNGFFENKGREHASYVHSYLLRSEIVADAWVRAGLGVICTGHNYAYQEKDIVDAYFKTIGILIKNRITFSHIEKFILCTLEPMNLLRQFEYDILVIRDPKSFLQEYMQANFAKGSAYYVQREKDRPAHLPIFVAQV